MCRYSRKQILSGLMPAVVDAFGIDDDELPYPGERIDEHLKRLKVWEESDLSDLWFRCEKVFDFKVDRADWMAFSTAA
ncbi:MAG: hypothetical protein M3552_19765 [Planctomycetota bacterium]|nr:hypothetical protein [Planctomycetaceae bacterium]MDQ3332855.1 hypothetical protein [Planctomycetota bacterium]